MLEGGKKGGSHTETAAQMGGIVPPLRALESGDFSFLFFKIQG